MAILAISCAAALLAIWVGYPLAIAAIAGMRPVAPPNDPEQWPEVSVVIASREPSEAVEARVRDCLAAEYAPDRLEVVVSLDSAGPTRVHHLTLPDPRARAVEGDEPGGKPTALNAGVRAARGELLVFADTQQRFDTGAIRELVRALRSGTYGAVSGMLELPERLGSRSLINYYWRYERHLRRDESTVHSAVGVSGSIYAMRRSDWSTLPSGLILDDLYLPMRLVLAGKRVGLTALARARDVRLPTAGREYQRKVRTLTGIFQVCAWLPGVLVPGRNPIWFQFVCHKLLRLLTPYLVIGTVAGTMGWLTEQFGPTALVGVAGLLLLGAIALALATSWSVVRDLCASLLSLQAAIVVATFNGLTARWDVWRK